MSASRFTLLFREAMGITFAKFALRTRLAAAARELLAGDSSVKKLALRWKFNSTSHFCHVFADHYDCTPSEYRERRRASRTRPRQ